MSSILPSLFSFSLLLHLPAPPPSVEAFAALLDKASLGLSPFLLLSLLFGLLDAVQ